MGVRWNPRDPIGGLTWRPVTHTMARSHQSGEPRQRAREASERSGAPISVKRTLPWATSVCCCAGSRSKSSSTKVSSGKPFLSTLRRSPGNYVRESFVGPLVASIERKRQRPKTPDAMAISSSERPANHACGFPGSRGSIAKSRTDAISFGSRTAALCREGRGSRFGGGGERSRIAAHRERDRLRLSDEYP